MSVLPDATTDPDAAKLAGGWWRCLAILPFLWVEPLSGGTIVGSKHDLSSSGSGPTVAHVCMFCHTPHNANATLGTANAPLWNRFVDQKKVYVVFTSASMDTVPGKPSQSISAVCLGCHDGTVGKATVNGRLGDDKMNLINHPAGSTQAGNCQRCHTSHFGLNPDIDFGLDLRNMHPIAMAYPTAAQDAAFNRPLDGLKGWDDVKLYNGKVECGSCHQPHDPTITPFLRRTADAGELCLVCHIK